MEKQKKNFFLNGNHFFSLFRMKENLRFSERQWLQIITAWLAPDLNLFHDICYVYLKWLHVPFLSDSNECARLW